MKTYCAIHIPSKKFYIGSSTNFEQRQKDHYRVKTYPFHRKLNKSPNEFFWFVSVDDGLDTREEEQFYLDFWFGHPLCWNLSKFAGGGFGWDHVNNKPGRVNPNIGAKRTENTKAKMRAAKPKGVYQNRGRKFEGRCFITMTHLDGTVETRKVFEWREMGVRWDRGIKRNHDKGWRFPCCPLEQEVN